MWRPFQIAQGSGKSPMKKEGESSLLITKLKVLTNTANPLPSRQNRMTAMLADMPQMDHDKVFLHLADVFSKLLKIKKGKW